MNLLSKRLTQSRKEGDRHRAGEDDKQKEVKWEGDEAVGPGEDEKLRMDLPWMSLILSVFDRQQSLLECVYAYAYSCTPTSHTTQHQTAQRRMFTIGLPSDGTRSKP